MSTMDAKMIFNMHKADIDRLDRYAAKIQEETGLPVSRSAAARKLIADGLKAAGITKDDEATE